MTQKFYRPLGNRILVARDVAPTTTPGGLHIPAAAQSKSDRGVVRYVGPGGVDASTGRYIPVSVKPGDVVLFPRSAIEVDIGGKHMVMLSEAEVFAVEFGNAEEAAAFGGVAVKSRRRRSDAGTKRRRKGVAVEFKTALPEGADAVQTSQKVTEATVERAMTDLFARKAAV